MTTAPKLALLAGGGPLPRRLEAICRDTGRPCFVAAFRDQTDADWAIDSPHDWFRIGAVGRLFERLRAEGVEELCKAGKIHRPTLRDLAPDWQAIKLITRFGYAALGDDALLSRLNAIFEEQGFRVVGPHQIVADLLAKPGVLTSRIPDAEARTDIQRGLEVARAVGAIDVGQGAVVQQGLVLAVEAIEGTDAMLERAGTLRRPGPGGVLVKARKPQQDVRLDLPTIGVTTVERAAAAGLRGIAVEAGGALIVDAEAVGTAADRLGLFVLGLDPETWPARSSS